MRVISVVVLGLVATIGWAQSNDYIDKVLASPTISYGQAAYLVTTAGGLSDEAIGETAAVALLKSKGLDLGYPETTALNIGEYSYLVTKFLDLPAGVMYSLFPGPRYALRELVAKKIVAGQPSPDKKISGEEALRYLGNALAWKEPQ